MTMRYSFSRIETYQSCPYKFRLRYIDKLDTLPDWDDAANPLTIGTAMHHGIEQGVWKAVSEYLMGYPVDSTELETEALKLEVLVPKVRKMLDSDATFEFKLETKDFIGYVDYISTDGTLLDFKYSNNRKHYLESPQIHLYRFLLEKVYGMRITRQGYLFIPKVNVKQEVGEDDYHYRLRLMEELNRAEPEISYVDYSERKAAAVLSMMKVIGEAEDYPKNKNRLCWYCDYRRYCETEGKEDYMILPKNERRAAGAATQRRLWIYGAPFSGKTTLADKFPDVLMLNTDGNIKYTTAPYIRIRDEVETDGHIRRTTLAWGVFKDAIKELEAKGNNFKSIVVDLVEDTYEACRRYMYQKLNITHESDGGYGKGWDMVKTEFLSTMKRLMNLDYENIILISHEDMSKDITKRSGDTITAIRPNIQEKIANKLAGMVDVVIRCVVIDGEHLLSFKTDEVVFGGGRINFAVSQIPNDYDELCKLYGETTRPVTEASKQTEELPDTPMPETPPRRRSRAKMEVPTEVETVSSVDDVPAVETPQDEEAEDILDPEAKAEAEMPAPPKRRRRRTV